MIRFTFIFLVSVFLLTCDNETLDKTQEQQSCDNGTYTGRVNISTQQEVNDFGALCYTKIDGSLLIKDLNETEDKITDLTPLLDLIEVYTETYPDSLTGTLEISTSLLTNFEGLDNLKKVGRLIIEDNFSLISLNGLGGLTEIANDSETMYFSNELKIKDNSVLQSLNGLNNLFQIGFGNNTSICNIINNPALENLDGLENLSSIYSSIPIFGPGAASNLWIYGNDQLTNINGLSNLINMHGGNVSFLFVGDVIIDGCRSPLIGNQNLSDYCGLQNLITNEDFNNLITGRNCYEYFGPSIQDILAGNCAL